jgi:hypothetical protein
VPGEPDRLLLNTHRLVRNIEDKPYALVAIASMNTSKPANGEQLKTGQWRASAD